MDDPFAILRIPSFTVRKESDLPKLKERAKNLVKQYEKVNKFDKAREVEVAYRTVKEMVIKRANCAGSKAFNKVMVNRPAKSSSDKAPPKTGEKSDKSAPKNPAEVHFLKAQGAKEVAGAANAKPAPAAPAPAQPYKSREERLKEKLEARRAAASEKDKRAAAIKEKLAAKRAKKAGNEPNEAMPNAASPESMASLDNMASPESSAVEGASPMDQLEQGLSGADASAASLNPEDPEGGGKPKDSKMVHDITAKIC